ncbi:MAG: hypothetical protein RIC35_09700 [Marinoscillum sp.]
MLKIIIILLVLSTAWQEVPKPELTQYTGVYRGKTLFIQNPYNQQTGEFCVLEVKLNKRPVQINYMSSALKIDFEGIDLNVPVTISIGHRSGCTPIIINADAIAYHNVFAFREISITDTALVWSAVGDVAAGSYLLEGYENGIWREKDTIQSKGKFGGTTYVHFPQIDEGANKLRIRYNFPNGDYLYSREIDFHYYEEPVTFKPYNATTELELSRTVQYDIYDAGGKLMLSGVAKTIDVSKLPRGEYVIYFDLKQPAAFKKI